MVRITPHVRGGGETAPADGGGEPRGGARGGKHGGGARGGVAPLAEAQVMTVGLSAGPGSPATPDAADGGGGGSTPISAMLAAASQISTPMQALQLASGDGVLAACLEPDSAHEAGAWALNPFLGGLSACAATAAEDAEEGRLEAGAEQGEEAEDEAEEAAAPTGRSQRRQRTRRGERQMVRITPHQIAQPAGGSRAARDGWWDRGRAGDPSMSVDDAEANGGGSGGGGGDGGGGGGGARAGGPRAAAPVLDYDGDAESREAEEPRLFADASLGDAPPTALDSPPAAGARGASAALQLGFDLGGPQEDLKGAVPAARGSRLRPSSATPPRMAPPGALPKARVAPMQPRRAESLSRPPKPAIGSTNHAQTSRFQPAGAVLWAAGATVARLAVRHRGGGRRVARRQRRRGPLDLIIRPMVGRGGRSGRKSCRLARILYVTVPCWAELPG